jgi:hypothetical protein
LAENAIVKPKMQRTKTDMVPVALGRAPGTPGAPRGGAPGTPRAGKASDDDKGPVIALSTPAKPGGVGQQNLGKASEEMNVDLAVNTADLAVNTALPPSPPGLPPPPVAQAASSAAAAADDEWMSFASHLRKRAG